MGLILGVGSGRVVALAPGVSPGAECHQLNLLSTLHLEQAVSDQFGVTPLVGLEHNESPGAPPSSYFYCFVEIQALHAVNQLQIH